MGESFGQPMKLELPAIPVQELIKSTTNLIPQRYIFHDTINASSPPCMDTPVIDLQLLLDNSSSSESLDELGKLRSVLCSWGCFQLINHGIPSFEIDKLRAIAKEFFALPHEEKQKYSRTVDWFEGYGSDTVTEGEPFNWNDRLHLKTHPLHHRNLKFWPQFPPNFREILDEYAVGMKKLLENLLKAIAKSLDVDENGFLSQFGEDGITFTRFNFYPPCSSPDKVFGLKPHSDVTMITILVQDKDVEGLQVLKDDQWYKVPIVPDALFINVGDQLEIMSNGIIKSVVHKVVIDKERERISVAVASIPSPDKEIGPLTHLIDREGAQLYKKITNYIALFLQHIARGERAINALKM
ncbi:oxoglutarate-dependent flavonoid 7-O-demethylase 1-like [Silene latifolia]|uniref:oxoglutarate-dependent flavonoid 7-O-demethylase 1-like n=1 Tax=Silene latifolia TaxID=37657 RepID=UPI003D7857E1